MAKTKDDAHADRVAARAWLLALMTGRCGKRTNCRARGRRRSSVRRAQGEDEDEWALLASDVEDILRRLIAHGWLRETSEGWRLAGDFSALTLDDAVRVLEDDCH